MLEGEREKDGIHTQVEEGLTMAWGTDSWSMDTEEKHSIYK